MDYRHRQARHQLKWPLSMITFICLTGAGCMHKYPQNYPTAKKSPHLLNLHGVQRTDNYFWLKDRNNPEVIAHLENENEYTAEVLAPIKNLEEKLFLEMKSRTNEAESSVPVIKGAYQYWAKYVPGGQYPVFLRKPVTASVKIQPANFDESQSEILIDGNALAKDKNYFQSTAPIMSPDQNHMAYGIDTQGRRFYDIYFKDLKSKKINPIKIENTTGNLVWAADNKTVFYSVQDPETLRSDKIFRLNLETGKKDLIYQEKDETYGVYLYQSLEKKHIFILSSSTLTTELRWIPSHQPEATWKVFFPREREHEYEVHDGGDRFYIISNWKAKNNRIFELPFNQSTDRKNWKEIIPHSEKILITQATPLAKALVVSEKQDGLDQIHIYTRDSHGNLSTQNGYIPFNDKTYTAQVHSNVDYHAEFVRYDFESMRLPESTFDYSFTDKKNFLQKTKQVPGYHPENYKTDRIWITARDGVKVPVSILMQKNFKPDGSAAALIYGYGSYGHSSDPFFSQSMISLVDRGFIYAIAHIRGGSELGREWYDQGRVLNKKNTFHDFIDATDGLIQMKYANSHRVFAYGGSAGGLLMGAIANERPDLYQGIVAAVPFVDVVTTMLDDSIPLTTGEYDEWGNPHEKKYFDYILSYSPYDNVKSQNYPNMLITTGLHDSQVQYWEPAKWVAKLRELKTDSHVILLKTNMNAGHGGASGRYEYLKEKATDLGFILYMDGQKE